MAGVAVARSRWWGDVGAVAVTATATSSGWVIVGLLPSVLAVSPRIDIRYFNFLGTTLFKVDAGVRPAVAVTASADHRRQEAASGLAAAGTVDPEPVRFVLHHCRRQVPGG